MGSEMLIPSFLHSFMDGPGQDVSCGVNKVILLNAHNLKDGVPRHRSFCAIEAYR